MRIELHSDAYDEIEAAKCWYDNQSEGLGDRFMRELDRAMSRIRESPNTWPAYVAGTRRFLLHRFPFAVVYLYDEQTIWVYALMHLRRKPGYWRKRTFS